VATLALVACSGGGAAQELSASPSVDAGRADIDWYSLVYQCDESGSPPVILEPAHRVGDRIDTFGQLIQPEVAKTTRVCTYDRAGDGTSDARPASVTPRSRGCDSEVRG
jgi:hypothetical protein